MPGCNPRDQIQDQMAHSDQVKDPFGAINARGGVTLGVYVFHS